MSRALAIALAAALPISVPAAAQERLALRASLSRIGAGDVVQLRVRPFEAVAGVFLGIEADALRLRSGDAVRTVPLTSIEGVWVRERATMAWAKRGGAIAGVIGAAGFGLSAAYLLSVMGSDTGSVLAWAAGGTLLSAAGGALLGGLTGATVERWTRVWPARGEPGPEPARIEAEERAAAAVPVLGSLDVAATYGRTTGDEATAGGSGGRAALLAEFRGGAPGVRRVFAVGPELALYDLGRTPVVERPVFGPDTVQAVVDYAAFRAGGVARLGVEGGAGQVYGLVELGLHGLHSESRPLEPGGFPAEFLGGWFWSVGYGAGAGFRADLPAGGVSLGLEARWHGAPTFDDRTLVAGFWTAAAGVRIPL